MDYLAAEAVSIFLLENDDTELVCHGCVGPVDITGLRLGAAQGIVGKAVSENACLMVRDVTRTPFFMNAVDQRTGFVTHAIPPNINAHRETLRNNGRRDGVGDGLCSDCYGKSPKETI